MLLILPWIFMLIAIALVLVLWNDYLKETRSNAYKKERDRMREEKERMMLNEPESDKRRHHKAERRRYRQCC